MKLGISRSVMSLATLMLFPAVAAIAATDPQMPKPETLSKPEQLVEQASQCRSVSERLERLRCFDRVFETPLHLTPVKEQTVGASESWLHAMDSLAKLGDGKMMHLTEQGDDAWLILLAANPASRFADDQKPVLMMSCIHRISRVELALPSEIPDARAKVTIQRETQYWRSDDAGLLLSSGRGMPAISLMKIMAGQDNTVLRSNSKVVDGLTFDTSGLSEALKPLRTRCDW
ncbi:type VI secretion system-associated protein VasI [Vibrio sp. MEBiC08052]|uniref:type VI secretion system-associated protein VasI n=1 Tax=Vibrio sp. MEBiC08052 TaxID=1761910 RepID=UPI00074068E3|nr:type VI secretion system-associated protein VasI [Vibrio sp. MEBiC08052]KUI97686.1 type VI secretion-associated protein, VC_A0118 family [Vibrio sp. MEBiC08052]